jgi:hypothetical protein
LIKYVIKIRTARSRGIGFDLARERLKFLLDPLASPFMLGAAKLLVLGLEYLPGFHYPLGLKFRIRARTLASCSSAARSSPALFVQHLGRRRGEPAYAQISLGGSTSQYQSCKYQSRRRKCNVPK